jgi:hypothetical protein
MTKSIKFARLTVLCVSCAQAVHCFAGGQQDGPNLPEPRALIEHTIEQQKPYIDIQNKYACFYQMDKRDHYDSGRSTHAVEQTDQVVILHGGQVRTLNAKTSKEVEPKKGQLIASLDTFSTWNDSLFRSVFEHSLLNYEGPQTAPRGESRFRIDGKS